MKPQWLLALKLVKMLSWQLIREYNIFYTRAFDVFRQRIVSWQSRFPLKILLGSRSLPRICNQSFFWQEPAKKALLDLKNKLFLDFIANTPSAQTKT